MRSAILEQRRRQRVVSMSFQVMLNNIPQGNRISKLSDKLGQVFVIPACELELSTQGRLGVVLSHDIESHVAQDGEIVGSIVEAISGLILVHNDVEAPMEPIFDAPMGTHYIREALGGQGCAERVIGCL